MSRKPQVATFLPTQDDSGCDDETVIDARERRKKQSPKSREISGFELVGVLGSGGGGTVYRARRSSDGLPVAIKLLRRELSMDQRMVTRFEREIRAIQLVGHPNIVQILEVGRTDDEQPYYVMELIEGRTLRRRIRDGERLSNEDVAAIFIPIAEAVLAAHEQGIVHRDLKSSNVIVHEEQGQAISVKLLDFGVAKIISPEPGERGLTRAGTMLGTAFAMAPEQVRGLPIDHRADIYALGIMLYEMLTRSFPFTSDHQPDLLRMHLETPPPRPSEVIPSAAPLDAVVLRALQKQRDARYATVQEMIDDIRRCLQAPQLNVVASSQSTRAIGICVRALITPGADEEQDDIFDDMMSVQEIVEEQLSAAGFQVVLSTTSAVLGIRELPGAPPHSEPILNESVATAQDILDELLERDDAHPDLQVHVLGHIDSIDIVTDGQKIVTGSLVDFEKWPIKVPTQGSGELIVSDRWTRWTTRRSA